MQRSQLNIVIALILTITFIIITTRNCIASDTIINVELFSKFKTLNQINISSVEIIDPLTIHINPYQSYKLINKNDYINILSNKTKEKLPKEITLKSPQQNKICIQSENNKKHCYKGEIIIKTGLNKLIIINKIPKQDYLNSVIGSELPNSWPEEAVKAQFIAIHSYLLSKIKSNKRIKDSTEDQFYGGIGYENTKYNSFTKNVQNIILTNNNNQTIEALYHSTCGGHTEDNDKIFGGEPLSYLRSVPCNFCKESNFFQPKIFQVQNPDILNNILANSKNSLKYHIWLEIGKKFGWGSVPGVNFKIDKSNKGYIITSKGAGHTVGLCQWGAKGMAQKGYNYKKILMYYYKQTKFTKIVY